MKGFIAVDIVEDSLMWFIAAEGHHPTPDNIGVSPDNEMALANKEAVKDNMEAAKATQKNISAACAAVGMIKTEGSNPAPISYR